MKYAAILIACLLVSVPIVGFAFGVLYCEGCEENILSYPLAGILHALFTVMGAGYFWSGPDELTNGWPYILPVGLVVYALVILAMRMRGNVIRESSNNT